MAKIPIEPLGRDETFSVVKRVLAENGNEYRKEYLLAFLLLAVGATATAVPAYLVANIVNDVFRDQSLGAAYGIAVLVLFVFTVRGLATYGYSIVLGKIANNIVARYQRRVYDHLLSMGVEFFKDHRSAFLVGRMNANISGVRSMLNDLVVVFARDFLSLIGLTTVMIVQDPTMSLTSVLVLPVLFYVISRYVKRIRKVARSQVNLRARVTSTMVESAQGIEILKAFTMEKQMRDKVERMTRKSEEQANRITKLNAKTKPPTEILAGLVMAGVIAFGGWRVIELGDDVGKLFSFLTAAMLAYDPARKLASFRVEFEKTLVNARMLYELLDTPLQQIDKPKAPDMTISKGEIVLNDVHFTYKTDGKVDKDAPRTIDGISFVAKAGQTTAMVGPSGGGKSTLIALIQRFYDLDSGAILVDGQNISDVTAHSLRRQISYVSQVPTMFEGSIKENIRLGNPDASDEDIFDAARKAQAHEFISQMPDGYDTPVGEMGSNLSGGQRQRISIARAIVRNAPILLLDEATSALDNESEKLVQLALDELMDGRTTIVIAHRLSTIQHADKIVVISDGKVVEEGTHEMLIEEDGGLYAKLHSIIGSQDRQLLEQQI